MYPNLLAEIARNRLSYADISQRTGISKRALKNKTNGVTAFTLPEAASIHNLVFPECGFEYLFFQTQKVNLKPK